MRRARALKSDLLAIVQRIRRTKPTPLGWRVACSVALKNQFWWLIGILVTGYITCCISASAGDKGPNYHYVVREDRVYYEKHSEYLYDYYGIVCPQEVETIGHQKNLERVLRSEHWTYDPVFPSEVQSALRTGAGGCTIYYYGFPFRLMYSKVFSIDGVSGPADVIDIGIPFLRTISLPWRVSFLGLWLFLTRIWLPLAAGVGVLACLHAWWRVLVGKCWNCGYPAGDGRSTCAECGKCLEVAVFVEPGRNRGDEKTSDVDTL